MGSGTVPLDFTPEQSNPLAELEAQTKALRTDAKQACAATDEGKIVPREGGGNPDQLYLPDQRSVVILVHVV